MIKPRVVLKVIGTGPFIEAPSHCPYSSMGVKTGEFPLVVNSVICPICKICEFIPEDFSEDFLSDLDKEKVINYLSEFNSKVASSISGQMLFLSKEHRMPLVILISPKLFEQLLQYVCEEKEKKQKLFNYFLQTETPICYILGCPVYLSRKLTKSSVQVVGEISWR